MKKNFYLSGLILLLTLWAGTQVYAQTTSFETSFEDSEPSGNWYAWADGFEETISGGEMTVAYNKSIEAGNHWDRFVLWIKPFDFSEDPFISFTIKSDADRNSRITLKDDAGAALDLSFVLSGDNEYKTFFFLLTEEESSIDLSIINEIQFDIGGSGDMSGTVVFDNLKLGTAAAPDTKYPTIDAIEDMTIQTGAGEQVINLTGISDGDGQTLPIEITASTDNEDLIKGLTVDYTSPNTSGTLRFTPAEGVTGEATVTITVTDAGEILNTKTITFFIKIGDFSNTGFMYSFAENGLPEGVRGNNQYSATIEGGALKVNINKNNRWSGFYWELGETYDISENPYVNLFIKANTDQVLQVFLVDIFGNGYLVEQITTQFTFHELVANKNEFRNNRIYTGNNFVEVPFDFSGADPDIVDLSRIAGIQFVSNGTALSFTGSYFIEEIQMGDAAVRKAYVGQVPDQDFHINTDERQKILVPEIKNAASIEIAGAEGLIENISVDEITYNTKTENERQVSYGHTYIEFDIVTDAVGTEEAILKAKGKEGYDDSELRFKITISENNPPQIEDIENIVVQTEVPQTIQLTGISDGDVSVEQKLTVTATSSNTEVADDLLVTYSSPGKYGELAFAASAPGNTTITVKVTDEGGASTEVDFNVTAYSELNQQPTIDPVENISVLTTDSEQAIVLTGISDGDDGSQNLTITAVSSDPGAIPHPVINYEQGTGEAELIFGPQSSEDKDVTITVTVADDGGNPDNDGDKSTETQFLVRIMAPPVTGYEFDLNDPEVLKYFKPEDAGTVYNLTIVDTLGAKALRINMTEKWTFGGIWTDIPAILDLSEYPVISYDILSIENQTWHWNYFYDMHGTDSGINRNTANTTEKQVIAPANEWVSATFDYRYEGDMNNSQGNPIDGSKINAILINLHNGVPGWPFTNYTGVVYLRNIKIGDLADYSPLIKYASIDTPAEQAVFLEDGQQHIKLTGITNGAESTEGVEVSATTTQAQVIPEPVISAVQPDGTALLSFKPEQTGSSNIRITITAEGAEPITVGMLVRVVSTEAEEFSTVTIDRSEKRQTIRGFGTYQNEMRWNNMYVDELGASAVRIGIIENQWEPVNDNNDPNVLNMEAFNYDAFDWAYFKDLKSRGVETFILTSWSPPAWMKRNLALSHREQAIVWEKTDNILEPYFYEEFAESMVAVVRAFKEEADIDLAAIGLQNEPFFNEPYASAILGGEQFAKLIEIVGDRFEKEGINHVGLYMPEQVFGNQWGTYSNEGYLATLRENGKADAYTNYFAVHGYDGSGITADFPTYSNWANLFDLTQQGDYPKELWMTETHIGYEGWMSAMQLAGAIHGSLWAGNITLWTNWAFGDMQLTQNVPNSSFYTSMNYFKYIRPGAVRVETTTDHADVLATAFENEDGRFTVVLINKGNGVVSIKLGGNDLPPVYSGFRTSRYENFASIKTDIHTDGRFLLPPSSVTTLVTSNIHMDATDNIIVHKNAEQTSTVIQNITNDKGTVDGLSLNYEYTNPDLFSQISLSDISENGTAEIDFMPAKDTTGYSEVTLTLTDENGNSKTATFFIYVIDVPVSAKPNEDLANIRIYPNPAESYVIIDMGTQHFDRIIFSDINGRTTRDIKINSPRERIELNGLPKGLYFINISGEKGNIVKKLIVH